MPCNWPRVRPTPPARLATARSDPPSERALLHQDPESFGLAAVQGQKNAFLQQPFMLMRRQLLKALLSFSLCMREYGGN
ncbi:protein of unknown function [Hyphomicrobium sp. MC1]|nr:protein of unknown function [Hyphomicrobium sp. MC1]